MLSSEFQKWAYTWKFEKKNPKAGYHHIQKVVKNIVEYMLQKVCYLATVTSNLSFLWP